MISSFFNKLFFKRDCTAFLRKMATSSKFGTRNQTELPTGGTGLPLPSGQYEVGCVDLMQEPGLLIRLFYPTQSGLATQYKYAHWSPHPNYLEKTVDFLEGQTSDFFDSPPLPCYVNPGVPALYGAPLIKPTSSSQMFIPCTDITGLLPIIVFSHGLGAFRSAYNGVCIDLASHGYVIAAVEHKDGSACTSLYRIPGHGVKEGDYNQYVDEWIPHLKPGDDEFSLRNKQVKIRSREVCQSLELLHTLNNGGQIYNMMGGDYDFSQFVNRLDLDLAAVVGHSFGAATALTALREDPRFVCGIALDIWTFPLDQDFYTVGLTQPVVFINSYVFLKWAMNLEGVLKLLKSPNENGISESSLLTVRGSVHINQMDIPFVIPNISMKYQSRLDKYIVFDINMKLCNTFLRRFLHKDPTYQSFIPNLDGGDKASEHIIFGTKINPKL